MSSSETGAGTEMERRPLLFGELFFGLREVGLPVGMGEWMTLMEAMSEGLVRPSLMDFYQVARAILVKNEGHFDHYDQVFAAVFGDAEMPNPLTEELLRWLDSPKPPPTLSPEELAAMESMPLDRLKELFEQRMKEQQERHDGGNRWVGTGGTSPFGHGGKNPAGIRVGGAGGGRTAVQVASQRRFQQYRSDQVLDTRSMAVALKKLRRLSRDEGEPELDVDSSIDATCRNAGDLELVFQRPRKNTARVLLLMDVGGSMDPWAHMVDRLFSAASGLNHWRRFESYMFHNCPYETLYGRIWGREGTLTTDVLQDHDAETFLVMVGDAAMAPTELLSRHGAVDYYHRNETPGLVWLHRLRSRFKRSVWLNPMPERWWGGASTDLIRHLYPMVPLTVDGLEEAVDILVRDRALPVPDLDERMLY
ncbi:MAG: VWA domain-containing protein [Myxococcota bacterium]|nr:VWA domain-containing protein [Myxococcota bacterium]